MSYRINISQQIANDYGIDLTTDEGQLLVSKLTLASIGETLLHEDLETISKDDLTTFKDELSRISQFCHEAAYGPIGERLDLQSIKPLVNAANSHLLSASSLYKLLVKQPEYYELYYGHLQTFRDNVFEIKEQLEEP